MVAIKTQFTVEDIRASLEAQYQTKNDNHSLFPEIYTNEDSVLKEISYNRFLLNKHFDDIWKTAKLNELAKTDIIAFCTQRLADTQNIHLSAKYNHALLVMTRNNLYANGAIEAYLEVADLYLKESNKDLKTVFEFINIVKELLQLCASYKKNKIKDLISYLQRVLTQDYPYQLKIAILDIFSEEKIFKANDIQNLPNKCLEIYNEINDNNSKERVLIIGLKLSKRLKDNDKIHILAELLGDLILLDIQEYDGINMAISHMNELAYQKAISYYKLAKKEDKVRATTLRLEENRTYHQYPRISIDNKFENQEQFINNLNNLVKVMLDKSLYDIFYPICRYNNSSLLVHYEQIQKLASKADSYYYANCLEAVIVDDWGNKHPTTHRAICMRDSFCLWFHQSTLLYIPLLLSNCMTYKKQNIRQFRSILKKIGFHMLISIKRKEGHIKVSLYDIVGKGLEEFIKRNNESFRDNTTVDWRFCIDFLTPKFEFIIRIVAEALNIPVTKVLKNGEVQFITLEKILADPKIKLIFNDDDILLFNQTFTKDGFNIRNNVAHGLYMPTDYTSEIALLVFLCVLRLCKITDYFAAQSKKQNAD